MACWGGKDQIAKALLENRALVNLPSFSGETPLLLASQHGYGSVVEVLMKRNADPTIRNNDLESPLDLACQFGHTAVVRFLLMRGEVIHMLRDRNADVRYKKPLHIAAKGGHGDVIRLLIESGADVNDESAQGTALHLAALYGKVDVVKSLLEAGADVRSKNKKNLTPLDMVNQFTTSRAGIEIKQLLREAAGERVVYARAVSDHINVYDPTCLRFKAGETITVLEQNEDGWWKGSVLDGHEETLGFFPAKAVKMISKLRDTQSLGSISSSSNSSISSAPTSKEASQQPTSPPRGMKDSRQPVGVVPIGSFEVLTLASGQAQDQRKAVNIPRLNSFKKGSNQQQRTRKIISYEETQEENANAVNITQCNSMDISTDSGLGSHGDTTEQNHSCDILPPHVATQPIKPFEPSVYDPVPPLRIKSSQRKSNPHIPSNQPAVSDGDGQHDVVPASPTNYADICVKSNSEEAPISPMNASAVANEYSQVYVTDSYIGEEHNAVASNLAPVSARRVPQKEFAENYERMNFAEESLRYSRSPEEKSSLKMESQARGYEDMTGKNSLVDESFPSPPLLPLKCQPCDYDDSEIPQPPPKKIESRAIQRRQDSYENVKPKHIVPVHAQNPFDKHSNKDRKGSSQDPAAGYGDYQNYKPPNADAACLQRSNTYENYRPADDGRDKVMRSLTVAEKPPQRMPKTRPVPLPPKLNRRDSQEPVTPNPVSPAEASSSSPFFCNMNLDELPEDEKELLSWLIELKLPQYFSNFQLEGYDMISIQGISPEDLASLNITKAGHKKKLLSEITKLTPSTKLPNYKPDDVGVWLGLIGLRIYEENFIEGGFDDMDFIKDLDLSDLEMIDIKKRGHQKKVLQAVQRLSDIELTADLDRVVGVATPTQPATSSFGHLQDPLKDESKLRSFGNSVQRSSRETSRDAPPPPMPAVDKGFLSTYTNFPPPFETESLPFSHAPQRPVPPKAPSCFTQSANKPRVSAEVVQSISRERAMTSPNVPKPKPKPKPGQNRGQVRTASEYHGNESSSKSIVLPSKPMPPNVTNAQINGDNQDDVTVSSSRDFWKHHQQEKQQTNTAKIIPTNTQSSSSNPVKPVTSPRPLPKPKPKPVILERDGTDQPSSPNQPIGSGSKTPGAIPKKVPPPAPPRRDSMKEKTTEVPSHGPNNGTCDRSRTMSGPLDEKIRLAFRDKKHGQSRIPPSTSDAVMEEKGEEETETSPAKVIVKELEATDSIMADIDNMIADFTNELDSMF
eukprot:gene2635-3049_t